MKNHSPMCSINTSCAVYHSNGICPDKNKCNCGASQVNMSNNTKKNYEHYSHTHCWNQEGNPACGIPLTKHNQCCLCDIKYCYSCKNNCPIGHTCLTIPSKNHMEEKISEPKKYCNHPNHDPATMKVREPGTYKHTCPQCGEQQVFEVPIINC